nr:hypothetical protein [Tanacetum cinerariifolium]
MAAEGPGDLPVPNLQNMKELCQPSLNGRGGPIASIAIQTMKFGLNNDMIQQLQNSCQFHGLPGDDANKHLDKFLHVTQSIKVNRVTDDALRLYLFPYSLTHHATSWLDHLPRNLINTFEQMAKMFLGKYFPPSMVTKLINEITNFLQRLDESLFEAWKHYKLYIDRCPNHNILPVTQIDTFYNGLTLRHRDTINAAAGGTFMKRCLEECYDLIENMTAHHNDWDSSAQQSESSSSITYSSDTEIAALKAKMAEINKNLMRVLQVNQQVKAVTPNCETCGGPDSFSDCPATVGNTQNVYAAGAYQGISYQPLGNRNMLSYRSDNYLGPPGFNQNQNRNNQNHNFQNQNMNQGNHNPQGNNQGRTQFFQGANQGQNQPPAYQAPAYQAPVYQAPVHQPQIPQPQVVTTNEFTNFMKANDAILKNMQSNMTSLTNSKLELKNMFGQFMKMNTASSSGSGTLPGNTITNPKEHLKGIITRSGTAYQGPTIPTTTSSFPVVEHETKATKDMPVNSSIIEHVASPVSAPRPNQRPLIPYPLRLQDQKLRHKANDQREKFFQIFKDLNFNISCSDALILMPKFGPSIKSLLTNKDKLCINLMPLSVWNNLSLPNLSPTCMTLELTNHSISYPVRVAEDVFVKVGTFHFSADFVIVEFDADPRVPLILERSFLKTKRALIDVFEGELTLRVCKEAITFNLDQTSRYSANYNDMTANRIDVIDMACEEYLQEVLSFFNVIASGNPTPYYDPIVSTTSPTLTPFGNSDILLEEVDAFQALEDDPTKPKVNQSDVDTEGDILPLKAFLNYDPSLPHPNQGNNLPEVRKGLKICEAKYDKFSINEPPEVELKDLPPHLEYVFLEGDDKLPVIIVKDMIVEEKTALIMVLKSHKRAIAWKLFDIKSIDLEFCTHKILIEEDFKPTVQHQRRVNPKIYYVIKQDVLKLLDVGLIYPISDNPWVNPVHCVPKKGGFTVVENEDNELISTRLVTRWCVCIDYRTGNSFTYDTIPESYDEVPNPPPQCHFNIYLCENPLIDHHCCYECGNSLNEFFCYQCTCEFCRNGAHVGYNCPAQVPSFQTLPSFPQQYPCCEDCGVLPETDHCQPPQYTANHPIFNTHNDLFSSRPTLIMGDEHLDTIPAMKSDEFIKSCVETLVPNPSESEGEYECDVPAGFTTFSNILLDADYDFDSEIIPMKIDPHFFNAESDRIESKLNHDSSIIISSKSDSLFDEFADELNLLKSIPSGIDETDCHPEEESHFTKRLLYDNSSPHPSKEIVFDNSNADIESFSPYPIPNEDSDSHMEEINLPFTPNDPMPLGIEEDDYDSERDIPILEELLDNYSLSLHENESYHFDIPSSYRPPEKPPDGNTGILNIKIMGDISDQKVPIHNLTITLVSNREKSPDLVSHMGLEFIQPSVESPTMIINGKNTPLLDVSLFYFYPLDLPKYGGN